ncbi:MAG TPA: signal peptidase II [Acidimicrobiales bacterium]|nr:signal peptidase II [Acidimicrobiales bacterium]
MQERGTVAPLTWSGQALARWVALGLAAAVVVADRLTTTVAEHHVHGVTHVWGPFGLALSFNSGFAFSLFTGRATAVTVLLCVGVAVLAVVVSRVRTLHQAVAGGLVLGGATGNLSERLFSNHAGQVADFITLSHWPTFNVADAGITVGVVVLAVGLVRRGEARPA